MLLRQQLCAPSAAAARSSPCGSCAKLRQIAVDETGIEIALAEIPARGKARRESRHCCAGRPRLFASSARPAFKASSRVCRERYLGDHRIVKRRDRAPASRRYRRARHRLRELQRDQHVRSTAGNRAPDPPHRAAPPRHGRQRHLSWSRAAFRRRRCGTAIRPDQARSLLP